MITNRTISPRIHPDELTVAPGDVVALEAISLMGDVKWEVLSGLSDRPVDLTCPFGIRTILRIPEDTSDYSVLLLRATNMFNPKLTATSLVRVERQGLLPKGSSQPAPRRPMGCVAGAC